jgi:hypothetical protein
VHYLYNKFNLALLEHIESHDRSKNKQPESQTQQKESQPESNGSEPVEHDSKNNTSNQSKANETISNAETSVEIPKCTTNNTFELTEDPVSSNIIIEQNVSKLPQIFEISSQAQIEIPFTTKQIDLAEPVSSIPDASNNQVEHLVIDLCDDDDEVESQNLNRSEVKVEIGVRSSESNTKIIQEAERIEANLVAEPTAKQSEKEAKNTPDIIEIKEEDYIDLSEAKVVFDINNGGLNKVVVSNTNQISDHQLASTLTKIILSKKQLLQEKDAKIKNCIEQTISDLNKKAKVQEEENLKKQSLREKEVQFKAGYRKRLIQSVENSFVNMNESKKSKVEEKVEEPAEYKCTICVGKSFDNESKYAFGI